MPDDYDLSELRKISVRGLSFNIMPRYTYHYTDKDYERFSLDLLDRIVEDDGVAVDIGAHYGIYSLLAAKKSRVVYTFEPVPENFEILKKNIRDNKLQDVIVPINKAISDIKGKVEFNVTWASDSAGFYEHPNADVIRKISVDTNSADNELKDVTDISFIKIDTEGHEIHVLDGLRSTLKRNKKAKMLIEFNPECLHNAGASSHDLITKIISFGYDIFSVYEDSRYMLRVDERTSEADILQGQKYLNLLCLPRGSWRSMLIVSHNAGMGGAEKILLDTVSNLLARKDDFVIPFVVLPGEGSLAEKFQHLPVAMKIIPMRGWTNNMGLDGAKAVDTQIVNSNALAELAKTITDFRPGVVCSHTMSVPWGAFVAKAYGIPHVWSIHEFGDLDHGLRFDYGYEQSMRYVDLLSETVLVNSRAVQDHLARFIPIPKLSLLHPSVQMPEVSPDSIPPVYKKGTELKLAISGRIMPSKGQIDAIKAVYNLRSKGRKVELIVLGTIGSQSYYDELVAYCKDKKIEKYVHFLGFQDNPFDYIAMADIFLMCSRNEAFGLVTLEAMLLDKAVIATNSGGSKDIVEDGLTGLLYEPGDSKSLTAKLDSLSSKQRRIKLARTGQEYAKKHFSHDYTADFYKVLTAAYEDEPQASPEFGPFKDILTGMYRGMLKDQREHLEVSQQHAAELQNFSDEYNKVYAAYNALSKEMSDLRNSKIVRARQKVAHASQRFVKLKRKK